MKDEINFTDAERYLISYFKSPSLSAWSRTAVHDGIYLLVPILLLVFQQLKGDTTWGIIGYAILVYRIGASVVQARRWNPTMRSMISKYEARIAELTGDPKDPGAGH